MELLQRSFTDVFSWRNVCRDALVECKFLEGDTLYPPLGDTREIALQVAWPSRGISSTKIEEEVEVPIKPRDPAFRKNWYQPAEVDIIDLRQKSRKRYRITHGRLYMLLWKDDLSYLNTSIPHPPCPEIATKLLRELRPRLLQLAPPIAPQWIMPLDSTNLWLQEKWERVVIRCKELLPHQEFNDPEFYGIPHGMFAPTAYCASLYFNPTTFNDAPALIETALCEVMGKKSIRLSAHGLWFATDLINDPEESNVEEGSDMSSVTVQLEVPQPLADDLARLADELGMTIEQAVLTATEAGKPHLNAEARRLRESMEALPDTKAIPGTAQDSVSLRVQGSNITPYTVQIWRNGTGNLSYACNCQAGQRRITCKHVRLLMEGDTRAVVGADPSEIAHLHRLLSGQSPEG
jgi:hypothetical protein